MGSFQLLNLCELATTLVVFAQTNAAVEFLSAARVSACSSRVTSCLIVSPYDCVLDN